MDEHEGQGKFMKKSISFFVCFLLIVMVISANMQTLFAVESPPEQTEESNAEQGEEVLEYKEDQGIESEVIKENREDEEVEQPEEVVKKKPEAKIAPTLQYEVPTYDGSTQRWTIHSGADLHYALANAVNGDTFVIMNDLHMGSDCGIAGHTHNSTEMDGISEELVVGPGGDTFMIGATEVTRNDLRNTTLNFISGTGSKVTIYRNDHKRHIVVGQSSYNSSSGRYNFNDVDMNVTLNFDGINLDGNQTYNVNEVVNKNVSNSSRGGIAIYNSDHVTLNGVTIINCFGDTMNANVDGAIYMGRDAIANGGALNGWYAKNLVINNGYFEGNYSGSLGGAIHLQTYGGTINNTSIKNNHSLRFEAYGAGGGIFYSAITDSATLNNVTIDGNSAVGCDPSRYDYGGGVGFASSSGTLDVKDSTISNNLSQRGGGILFSGKLILENVDVTGNTATDETRKEKGTSNLQPVGGGIIAAGGSLELKGIVNIKDNNIQVGNYATYGQGVGMSVGAVVCDSDATVTVSNNMASGKAGTAIYGGGMYVSVPASNINFSNWSIENNHIQGADVSLGGGMYANVNAGDFTLTDSKVTSNSAQYGGGLFVRFNNSTAKTATITNSEISGNIATRPDGLDDSDDTGSGAGIYTMDYAKLFTDNITFKNNNAEYGHAQPMEAETNYAADVATHDRNIKNTVELSTPYTAGKHYAYNNYDINYAGKMLHTVAYDSNGGSGSYVDTVTKGSNYTIKNIKDTTISRDGYTFKEWNTAADGLGDSFSEGTDVTITSNRTLYAIWEINTYTVTYHPNGGAGDVYNVNENHQANHIILSDVGYVREGYSFKEWNTKADGSGNTYLGNDAVTISGDLTLYAQWQKDKDITPPGGSHPSKQPDTDSSSNSNQKQQMDVAAGDATSASLWIVVMLLMTVVIAVVKTDRDHS